LFHSFKEKIKSPEEAPASLVEMAKQYSMQGGHWILFLNRMESSRKLVDGKVPIFI
jgi:hypothetical protein